jgi:hypothetical protein
VKRIDRDAMRRAIDIMRQEGPDRAAQIDRKLKDEGFSAAGRFASCYVQDERLQLKPWQTPPCDIWGYGQSDAIELRDRLLAAGLSIYEPDPVKALAEVEHKQIA